MDPAGRPLDAHHPRRSAAWVAVVAAVVLALTAWSRFGRSAGADAHPAGSPYVLMQLNLCLSGLAACYDEAAYPAPAREAAARIQDAHPDAVTLNEACREDAVRIARRTGYHVRFSAVIDHGAPLRCVRPGGRGAFGDAVLTRDSVIGSTAGVFRAQDGIEQRRWLCVATGSDVDVCTAHLATRRTPLAAHTNDAQCAELTALLARRAATRTVAFGGDVNRHASCAPPGAWSRTDASAGQTPGLQHVYGSGATLRSPSPRVVPITHSDHDALLVKARRVL